MYVIVLMEPYTGGHRVLGRFLSSGAAQRALDDVMNHDNWHPDTDVTVCEVEDVKDYQLELDEESEW